MKNKEQIYDAEISPLINQIIMICKEHKIPMFTTFQYSNEGFCTTAGGKDSTPVFDNYMAMAQCVEDNGFNIDKYLIWVMKTAQKHGHSSMYLNQLGVPIKD